MPHARHKPNYSRVATLPYCFWCERICVRTRDHVIPQYVIKRIPTVKLPVDNIVISCQTCNLERSKLTTLYAQIMKTKKDHKKYPPPKMLIKIAKLKASIEKLLPLWNKWVALEKEKLGWSGTEYCPLELPII